MAGAGLEWPKFMLILDNYVASFPLRPWLGLLILVYTAFKITFQSCFVFKGDNNSTISEGYAIKQ